jgi:ubiquitin carboxyl-terminal hydrolase 25/28
MAVSEYPGKMEHYRSCLEVIAKAGGDERAGLKRYLDTGSKEAEIIKRNDIPAGLQNIGWVFHLTAARCSWPVEILGMPFRWGWLRN